MSACKVHGYIVDGTSTGVEGVLIYAIPKTMPATITATGSAVHPIPIEVVTTSTGYFELNLIRNMDFVVFINAIGFRTAIRVPDEDSAVLWTLATSYVIGDSTPTDTGEDNW